MVGMESFFDSEIGHGLLAFVALRCRRSRAGLSKGKTSGNLQLCKITSQPDSAGVPDTVSRQERQLTVREAPTGWQETPGSSI